MQASPPAGRQNRLAREKSPYLLQHAANPVDWYPWGDEAFDRAVRLDRPVFLSIGYSTCHWCHVMAHESFEDAEVAELLNRDFVCIKVDREERPDIDSTYMRACQMMTGQGGWPLTIVMTPEKKPFFAATYLPKERRFAVHGLLGILPGIARAWREDRQALLRSSESLAIALSGSVTPVPGPGGDSDPDEALLDEGYGDLVVAFDPDYGGFGSAPKFPTPHLLLFLIRYWKRTGKKRALDMATRTLDALLDGGIHDHVGGGFHRYATDARWRVPHFEKMLYDQALLLLAFTEAVHATGGERYRDAAREIAAYVLRDLTSPEGAFFSGEDADSPGGEEGAFYLWTSSEMEAALGPEDGELAMHLFSVTAGGNAPAGEDGEGRNILYRTLAPSDLSRTTGIPEPEIASRERAILEQLLAARTGRPRPSLDDKVLTDWNGLMIAALAKASRVLYDPEYAGAAERAISFLLARMRTADGRLLHRYRDGEAAIPGFADDYTFVILALIELYEATFRVRYLREALSLNARFREHFLDAAGGGYFSVPDDGETLFSRKHEIYDGAIPSANSVACENLLRLFRMTGDPVHERDASALARRFAAAVREHPPAYGWFLCAVDLATGSSPDLVVAGGTGAPDTARMIASAREPYLPGLQVLFRSVSDRAAAAELGALAPFTEGLEMRDGTATAYVCSTRSCSAPLTDPKALRPALEGKDRGSQSEVL